MDEGWSESVSQLRAKVKEDEEIARVLCGMTRFMCADQEEELAALTPSARRREAKRRAYRVLSRSRAWGTVVQSHFPRALRLSIHPQPVGAEKFGIQLIRCAGTWTTPWHSVVLYHRDGTPELVRHDQAQHVGEAVVKVDEDHSGNSIAHVMYYQEPALVNAY
ncbi:L-tyrosine/L-tryptophan isonitrile synthase family protein [Corynebacterium poyangense]|uniref:L-tyrosine/L-tryptophan isonitrile synthase family protein n=1 Tax=Corynebacterium poyangense TaxID=2684405 RepID=A0A7H0SLH6_9CORY|nr:L-tyrosine/L-tryptophan isonitrile synthase family protein [Corynebacterium poyangense]